MKEKKYMDVDIKKIFLTAPQGRREKLILFFTLIITFVIFFRPIQFSQIKPMEAILISALPSLSISWAWIVLLRSLFRKSEYRKE